MLSKISDDAALTLNAGLFGFWAVNGLAAPKLIMNKPLYGSDGGDIAIANARFMGTALATPCGLTINTIKNGSSKEKKTALKINGITCLAAAAGNLDCVRRGIVKKEMAYANAAVVGTTAALCIAKGFAK